jgi:hypothetical protein
VGVPFRFELLERHRLARLGQHPQPRSLGSFDGILIDHHPGHRPVNLGVGIPRRQALDLG